MEIIEIIRSTRRTVAIEVKSDLSVIVRAPMKMKRKDIECFVNEKAKWIEKHIELVRQRNESKEPIFTDEEIAALANKARKYIPARVSYYASKMGVTFGRITIRNQHGRWGSCSSKGNLNFNCLLMLCPPEVCDYVVVHELCHRIELNHSERFWANVEKVMPGFTEQRKWLRDNGNKLIGRIKLKDKS